jgi:hypothetical protein
VSPVSASGWRIEVRRLAAEIAADAEFGIAARYWTVRLRLQIGATQLSIRLADGQVVNVTDVATGFDPYDIVLSAPEQTWLEILQPVPRPFYQDFWSAAARHDFRLEGDLDSLCAYYGAVRRLCDLLRAHVTEERP